MHLIDWMFDLMVHHAVLYFVDWVVLS